MEPSLIVIAAAIALLLLWSVRWLVADMRLRAAVSEELVRTIAPSDTVAGALGAPVRPAGAATGCVIRTSEGVRTLVGIPVAGPNGRGVLYVDGLRRENGWSFASVTLHVEQAQLQTAPVNTPGRRSTW